MAPVVEELPSAKRQLEEASPHTKENYKRTRTETAYQMGNLPQTGVDGTSEEGDAFRLKQGKPNCWWY